LKLPFDWLVHLDRQLISPVELWHVSPYRSHEVTQLFAWGGSGAATFRHTAPWGDETTRLYRFFEFVSTAPRSAGIGTSARVPGRLNLNAVWSPEVFRALCDRQAGNSFSAADVDTVFQNLVNQRSPGTYNAATRAFKPALGPTDQKLAALSGQPLNKPFWSLAVGPAARADALAQLGMEQTVIEDVARPTTPQTALETVRGIQNTLLRTIGGLDVPDPNPTQPRHPYQKKELLTKVFNNVTTRSNVFAVWLTVGFFEVTDDTARPVKLGAEVGKAENRHVRHRMFAIVDRTNLRILAGSEAGAAQRAGAPASLRVSGVDERTRRTWAVQPGDTLVLEPNTANEETVQFSSQDPSGRLIYVPTRDHPNPTPLLVRGNPGPWPSYDPRNDTDVVPYFAIID
jgi:hypothetical protein